MYGGTPFRSKGDPVLYLSNPRGIDDQTQRASLDTLQRLNSQHLESVGDPEIAARIQSYEMAYRLQASAPELMNLASEPKEVLDLYGIKDPSEATFARNCLLARRLIERGVRFVQLFHEAWDQHSNLTADVKKNAGDTDQASAALVRDLKQRGLLDDTLVIWGGNSVARRWSREAMTVAIITTVASACGSRAGASNRASSMARRTSLVSMSSRTRSTYTI